MMLNANNSLPPVPSTRDMQGLLELVSLLADPASARLRIAEFAAAAEAARLVIERAARDQEAAAKLQEEVETSLAIQRKNAADKIAEEHGRHVTECAARSADLDAREKKIREMEIKAEATAAEAERLKAAVERRVRLLNEPVAQ